MMDFNNTLEPITFTKYRLHECVCCHHHYQNVRIFYVIL